MPIDTAMLFQNIDSISHDVAHFQMYGIITPSSLPSRTQAESWRLTTHYTPFTQSQSFSKCSHHNIYRWHSMSRSDVFWRSYCFQSLSSRGDVILSIFWKWSSAAILATQCLYTLDIDNAIKMIFKEYFCFRCFKTASRHALDNIDMIFSLVWFLSRRHIIESSGISLRYILSSFTLGTAAQIPHSGFSQHATFTIFMLHIQAFANTNTIISKRLRHTVTFVVNDYRRKLLIVMAARAYVSICIAYMSSVVFLLFPHDSVIIIMQKRCRRS